MDDSDQQELDSRALEHAWRYFELHAAQRLTSFNFFLVMSGALSAAMAATMQGSTRLAIVGVALGLLLILTSFVFWKMDQRISFLIKHAEEYISAAEKYSLPAAARVFTSEPVRFSSHLSTCSYWQRSWTYGRCFRSVFVVMAGVGLAGAIISIMIFTEVLSWSNPNKELAQATSYDLSAIPQTSCVDKQDVSCSG